MPGQNVHDTVVRGPLANVSLAYRNLQYIAPRVFPLIDGVTAKTKILKYLKGDWFRDEAGIMAPGTRAPRGAPKKAWTDVTPKTYGFASEVTDEDRNEAAQGLAGPLSPDEDAIGLATDKVDLSAEVRCASIVKSSTWSGVAGEDAAGLWAPNDATNTFIADVTARIATIRSNTGVRPNVLLLTFETLESVKKLDDVLDRIRYTQLGVLTPALLAAIFDLEEVLIADAIKSSAKETKAGTEFTGVNVWETNAGKGSAFLYYRPRAPGRKTPSAGYYCREKFVDGQIRRTTTWREAAEHQDVYEVAEQSDIVQTGPDLGFYWYDTIVT